jgi:hypothetical protein
MQQNGRNELAEIAHLDPDLPLPQLVKIFIILFVFLLFVEFSHNPRNCSLFMGFPQKNIGHGAKAAKKGVFVMKSGLLFTMAPKAHS